jgi:hypothetical protein
MNYENIPTVVVKEKHKITGFFAFICLLLIFQNISKLVSIIEFDSEQAAAAWISKLTGFHTNSILIYVFLTYFISFTALILLLMKKKVALFFFDIYFILSLLFYLFVLLFFFPLYPRETIGYAKEYGLYLFFMSLILLYLHNSKKVKMTLS